MKKKILQITFTIAAFLFCAAPIHSLNRQTQPEICVEDPPALTALLNLKGNVKSVDITSSKQISFLLSFDLSRYDFNLIEQQAMIATRFPEIFTIFSMGGINRLKLNFDRSGRQESLQIYKTVSGKEKMLSYSYVFNESGLLQKIVDDSLKTPVLEIVRFQSQKTEVTSYSKGKPELKMLFLYDDKGFLSESAEIRYLDTTIKYLSKQKVERRAGGKISGVKLFKNSKLVNERRYYSSAQLDSVEMVNDKGLVKEVARYFYQNGRLISNCGETNYPGYIQKTELAFHEDGYLEKQTSQVIPQSDKATRSSKVKTFKYTTDEMKNWTQATITVKEEVIVIDRKIEYYK